MNYQEAKAKAKLKKSKRLAKSKRLGLNGARTLKGRRKKADLLFKAWIRERDGYKCKICGSQHFPQASHFISCRFNGTRYDPLNVDCFCAKCHMDWETRKDAEYRDWMIKKLGDEGYRQIIVRRDANISLQTAVDEFFKWYQGVSGSVLPEGKIDSEK